MTTNEVPPELTNKGQEMLSKIWADAKAETDKKDIRKALQKTPPDAERVMIEAVGEAMALRLQAQGWKFERDNRYSGGAYRAWVRLTTLSKNRADVVLDLER